MKYLALYRKYRPASFENVIGQDHIVKILTSQIKNGSIGHAYLFCGARGTGKTSVAKIFARAINGAECDNIDIMELDAASNNKVEDVRDLIEKAQYPPVCGKYKVYIIDEVHMLSGQAFNALLKTLEEPPLHTVFILATTEVYKLPPTILSRCMRFDFKLIPAAKIAELIKKILNDINKPFEDAAVDEIARAAEGSVRDALSIADTCISYSAGKLTQKDVLELLSASDRAAVARLCQNILSGDTNQVLSQIDELASAGKSIAVLNRDILNYLRDLTVIICGKDTKNIKELLIYPYELFNIDDADKYGLNNILRCIQIFSEKETELRYSLYPRIIFEAAALKAAAAQNDSGVLALEQRLTDIEKKVEALFRGNTAQINSAQNIAAEKEMQIPKNDIIDNDANHESGYAAENKKTEYMEHTETAQNVQAYQENLLENGQPADKRGAAAIWGGVIRTLRQKNAGLLFTICGELKVKTEGKNFIITADNDMAYEILTKPKHLDVIKSIIALEGEYNVIVQKGQ